MSLRGLAIPFLCLATSLSAQGDYVVRPYKTVGVDSLVMHVFRPTSGGTARPAVLLFHGGGFVWGGADATDGSARDYAARGVVAFSVEYRLADHKAITPIDQVEDTFDAIRWVRKHASEFGIDPARLILHGVSAGGYLAAMAAGSKDDGVRPTALVLWSPGIGPGDDPYFDGLFIGKARGADWSPYKFIRAPMPAMIIISGALDSVTFNADARRYCALVTQARGRCDLETWPNLGHLLSRKLAAQSQLRGDFDWDPATQADAENRIWAFLRSLTLVK